MRAILPGSFNPPTLGHLDLIRRGSKICDHLLVAVGKNSQKLESLFSVTERIAMLEVMTKDFPNVKVVQFSGLIVDFVREMQIKEAQTKEKQAQEMQTNFILKGIRNQSDLALEQQMAIANREMGGLDTLFLIADPKFVHISSSLVREIGRLGGRLHQFVPESLEDIIFQRLFSGC